MNRKGYITTNSAALRTWSVPPFQRERFNEALRNHRRVGEDIPDALIRPPQPIPLRPAKTAPIEGWIDGSMLRADIKRKLERVDPQR
jgi:hypothetical protein